LSLRALLRVSTNDRAFHKFHEDDVARRADLQRAKCGRAVDDLRRVDQSRRPIWPQRCPIAEVLKRAQNALSQLASVIRVTDGWDYEAIKNACRGIPQRRKRRTIRIQPDAGLEFVD
jgi:hypothetical protein